MATGLIALLDDVAGIAKVAAASVDDVAAHAAKASAKSAGVVIDDTAVTPRYVVGFAAERELPIVAKIAKGSLRNKLLILLPVALALSAFAPWAINPLLMLGGLYLCYEGAEKVYEAMLPHAAHKHEADVGLAEVDPVALEARKVAGAIRTDFILSAEIMAIALATVPDAGLVSTAVVLAIVAVGITAGVYGVVALIVKADDAGVALAGNSLGALRVLGRGIVAVMPRLLATLAAVGTAAMIWVGGGIIVHGLEVYGLDWLGHTIHDLAEAAGGAVPFASGFVGWLVGAIGAGVFGLVAGAVMIPLVGRVLVPIVARLK
jgi:predicted DNA repair protein MutK